MKAASTRSQKAAPQGVLVRMRGGKVIWPKHWPKQRKPPSDEKERKEEQKKRKKEEKKEAIAVREMEVAELIAALVDAAHTIGVRGIADNYSKYDFHLYPRHIASLFPKDHPKHSVYAAMDKSSKVRVIVPWPQREGLEAKTTNGLREKPFEIIGLLIRKILDADSVFFEAMTEAVRAAKIEAKQAATTKDSPIHLKGKIHAGKIVASMPSYGMGGDPDWFTRIPKPLRRGKAPYAIWIFCKARYDKRQTPPTRREIRAHLDTESIACRNLRTQLSRMNLEHLQEGERPRKT